MRKILILIITVALTAIIAGIYGIIHDQFTYTISNEYFTRFKFHQFGLTNTVTDALSLSPRTAVAYVGFMATWWTGLIIGLFQGMVGLMHKDSHVMARTIIKATTITLIITPIVGSIGLAYGWFYLSHTQVNWWFPKELVDKRSFITVGSMHNFSYLGGAIGLLAGVSYQLFVVFRDRKTFYRPH